MPNIPVRGLSTGGVIADVQASSLPLNAWSYGRNVVFTDGKARRSPVWKTVTDGMGANARYLATYKPSDNFHQIFVAHDDGSLNSWRSGVIAPCSETGFTAFQAGVQRWSSGQTGDVVYINHPGRVPRVLVPPAATFALLPNWDPTWRCQVMRDFNDQLVALNVSKGAINYPTMVKISDVTYFGAVPGSWDASDDTTLAYENTLADMDGPILDGLGLSGNFLIYTPREVWEMSGGGEFNFVFRQLFSNLGIASTNCVVEVGGLHYVFGVNDLYTTDGVSFKSLTEGKIRRQLARTIDYTKLDRCFVNYVPTTTEVWFNYVSTDTRCQWSGTDGCNAAAVFNIMSNTWSFVDLPNVPHVVNVNASTIPVWQAETLTWALDTRTWTQDTQPNIEFTVAASRPGATPAIGGSGRLLVYDWASMGVFAQPIQTDSLTLPFLERVGMAFDGPDAGYAPLRGCKRVRSLFPETMISDTETLGITFGSQMYPQDPILWDTAATPFSPSTDDRVDTSATGKYLAVRFTMPPDVDSEINGFDIDLVAEGNR